MQTMKTVGATALMIGGIAALSACGSEGHMGSAQIGVSVLGLEREAVSQVQLTIRGPDIDPPMKQALSLVEGQWKGIIGGIPAGANRHFFAEAFDADGRRLYAGVRYPVKIEAGRRAAILMLLQQTQRPRPFVNSIPLIESLYASSAKVAPVAAKVSRYLGCSCHSIVMNCPVTGTHLHINAFFGAFLQQVATNFKAIHTPQSQGFLGCSHPLLTRTPLPVGPLYGVVEYFNVFTGNFSLTTIKVRVGHDDNA